MNARTILILRITLGLASIFMAYRIYRIIMEPIEFEQIKTKRYAAVQENMEQLREAQLLYKEAYGVYADNVDFLEDFIAYDSVDVVMRKDSSFMYYDQVYQMDRNKDTVIFRIVGRVAALEKLRQVNSDLFGEDLATFMETEGGYTYPVKNEALDMLSQIPFNNETSFKLATGVVSRNGVKVPVFELAASHEDIFHDVYKRYDNLIENLRIDGLIVGSLVEPTLSGNWK